MTDDKQFDEQEQESSGLTAAQEAAEIFRAAEEASRRSRNPYQSAVPTTEYDDEEEYEDDGEDYDFDEGEALAPTVERSNPGQIRFINRTHLDEQDVRRLVERIFDGKRGVQGYRIFLVIFALLVIFYAIFNIVRGLTVGPVTYSITGGFLLVMAAVMLYMGLKGVVNQTYKRTLRNAQSFMTERVYHFYEGEFSQTTDDNSYSVTWADVANWTEDDYSFYVIIGQSYAIVHKNGFTLGDEESFRAFLTEKATRRVEKKRLI